MNYPVTTPYGQVPGYPLNNGFHNGIDYGYPSGTAVVVNGVTIALSDNTGETTGPHLHVGKYIGSQVQDPGVGNGFNFEDAVVYDTGEDAVNGIYVRITGDGALWNYLHLEKVFVTKGQVLKGATMATDALTKEEIISIYTGFYDLPDGETNPDLIAAYTGKPLDGLLQQLHAEPTYQAHYKQVNSPTAGFKPYSGDQLFTQG